MISIIIPIYNQANWLAEAVESAKAQTYGDWECILVNDGSTDNSREVSLDLAKQDSRIRYLEQKNQGPSAARNFALDAVRGDYIQFLDGDDRLAPRKFELQLEAIARAGGSGLKVSYTDFTCVCLDDEVSVPDYFRNPRISEENPLLDLAVKFGKGICLPPHSFLFDGRIFRDHGIRFDPELRACEDFECWLRIFELRPKILRVDQKLVEYRWHKGSLMQDRELMANGYRTAVWKAMRHFRHHPEVYAIMAERCGIAARGYFQYRGGRRLFCYFKWAIQSGFRRGGLKRRILKPFAKIG
jgi:glycosyltransferase involved in cell wall biosynthesis